MLFVESVSLRSLKRVNSWTIPFHLQNPADARRSGNTHGDFEFVVSAVLYDGPTVDVACIHVPRSRSVRVVHICR